MEQKTIRELERIRSALHERMDADETWVTIKGTHVLIDKEGNPQGEVGKKIRATSKKSGAKKATPKSPKGWAMAIGQKNKGGTYFPERRPHGPEVPGRMVKKPEKPKYILSTKKEPPKPPKDGTLGINGSGSTGKETYLVSGKKPGNYVGPEVPGRMVKKPEKPKYILQTEKTPPKGEMPGINGTEKSGKTTRHANGKEAGQHYGRISELVDDPLNQGQILRAKH